jgi:hypothetical protein
LHSPCSYWLRSNCLRIFLSFRHHFRFENCVLSNF